MQQALVIAMEILWVRHEPKDCNGKHDPAGNAQKILVIGFADI